MDHQSAGAGIPESEPGLLAGFAGAAKSALALLHNRLELAALEAGEVRDNLLRATLIGVAGLVVLLFALGLWTALIVVLAWDAMGWTILLLMAALYSLLSLALLFQLRSLLTRDKLSLPATMAELRKDRDALL
jgi:uncharacterized membrane protein YqjE